MVFALLQKMKAQIRTLFGDERQEQMTFPYDRRKVAEIKKANGMGHMSDDEAMTQVMSNMLCDRRRSNRR